MPSNNSSSSAIAIALAILLALAAAAPLAYAQFPSPPSHGSGGAACIGHQFTAAAGFGDSTSDTGNDIIYSSSAFRNAARLPYGETYLKKATGRFSNGRLIVDFVMSALGQPLLAPHLAGDDAAGAHQNFAFSGATALTKAQLAAIAGHGVDTAYAPVNLGIEMQWFADSVASGAFGGNDLSEMVVFIGEMGGNDYNYALAGGADPSSAVSSLVGPVLSRLDAALRRLLASGVRHVIMLGQFPQGCLPIFRQQMAAQGLPASQLDARGCIPAVNAVSQAHNDGVRRIVSAASAAFPDANLVFLDSMAAYLHVLDHPSDFGITNVFDPCDAKDALVVPSIGGATGSGANSGVCSNPQNYLSWDGIHMTDTMHTALFSLFNSGPAFAAPFPNFLSNCAAAGRA